MVRKKIVTKAGNLTVGTLEQAPCYRHPSPGTLEHLSRHPAILYS